MKRTKLLMIVLVLPLAAKTQEAIAQSDGSAIARIVTTFFAEANTHNIGCGGLDDISQIDKGAAAALFVEQPSVTEVVPPWHWEGTTAFKDWMADLATYCKKHGDSPLKFTLAKPVSEEVEGDHGNVIVPLALDYKEGGKPVHATGLANVVLLKNQETWKILAFTFTQQ